MTDDLAARVARLEAVEEIRRLKARYCDVCDDGHDPERILELFTRDAVWESASGHGRHEGRGAIRSTFAEFRDHISFSHHNVTNLIVDVVDDQVGHGSWHFFGLFESRSDTEPYWSVARYDETYRREEGAWRIHHLRFARMARVPAPGLRS